MKIFIPTVLLVTLWLGGCQRVDALPKCVEPFNPIVARPPVLPGKNENSFQGAVKANVTIGTTGNVVNVEIVADDLRPVGRGRQEPYGYREAVLSAVSEWRYPARAYQCVKEITVVFEQ